MQSRANRILKYNKTLDRFALQHPLKKKGISLGDNGLDYHNSWEWLMPLVRIIKSVNREWNIPIQSPTEIGIVNGLISQEIEDVYINIVSMAEEMINWVETVRKEDFNQKIKNTVIKN